MERNGEITFKGNPLTLVGDPISVGQHLPDAELVDPDLNIQKISELFGGPLLISTVPSLDTSVCSIQTKSFEDKAAQLDDAARLVTVSADLPFAQKRFADEAAIGRIVFLSDHRGLQFAKAAGLLIKELHLVARSVTVVDGGGVVRYHQLVNEVTSEPDYDAALEALAGVGAR